MIFDGIWTLVVDGVQGGGGTAGGICYCYFPWSWWVCKVVMVIGHRCELWYQWHGVWDDEMATVRAKTVLSYRRGVVGGY